MATILVLGVKAPFTSGGAEVLVRGLVQQIAARGHLVDTIELPYNPLPKEALLTQAAMWRALNLDRFAGNEVDLVIATKFPSYFARAKRKSVWLVHQHRACYDLYGTRYSDFSDDPRDEALRRSLVSADIKMLAECDYVSGISRNVVERLRHYNAIEGEALYPPLPLAGRYRCAPHENYILSVGRLCSIKRVDLMIKAMPMIHQFIKLKIVGTPDEPGISEYFKNEIDKHHLWDRVDFLGRVSDDDLIDLYAKSLAVYYAPHNEDYGYVTLEAFAAKKAVVTAHDSGGVLEFVTHEHTGLIVEPTSDAIAKGFNRIIEDDQLRDRLGENAVSFIQSAGLSTSGWEHVVSSLLKPLAGDAKLNG